MTKKQRQAVAKKELKRVEKLEIDFFWHVPLVRMRKGVSIDENIFAEDIDDEPETPSQMCRQLADEVMRPHVRAALEAYKQHLKNIAKTGTTDLRGSG
jgi:hypothetical protein